MPGGPTAGKDLFKTQLCKAWQETGRCDYELKSGKPCTFAHGTSELRPRPGHLRRQDEKGAEGGVEGGKNAAKGGGANMEPVTSSAQEGPSAGIISAKGREAAVAAKLMGLLEAVPGREMAAAKLCSALYQECAEAKDVVGEHRGLKRFITTPLLEHAVRFVADEVWLSNCRCMRARTRGGGGDLGQGSDG